MKRNRNIPLPEPWQSYNPQPLPGFLYCRLSHEMGSGLGGWEVLVVIDHEKREYNDYVSLMGYYEYNLTEEYVESIKENGINLRRKVIRTILRLFRSEAFRKFTECVPVSRAFDVNYATLEIYNTSKRVCLYMQRFDFYRGIALPRNEYQRSARKWTKGLRGIYRKAYSSYFLWMLKN